MQLDFNRSLAPYVAQLWEEDTIKLGLEPLDTILLGQPMLNANPATPDLPVLAAISWARQVHIEIHTIIPVLGSYLIPRSMCSVIPNPKLPFFAKFFFLNSYSFTFKPFSRISSAFSPRTVTWQAIFSLRRTANERMVRRALEKTGCCSVSCSNTLAARVSRSPLSPTQIFRTSFSTRICLIGLSDLSAMLLY